MTSVPAVLVWSAEKSLAEMHTRNLTPRVFEVRFGTEALLMLGRETASEMFAVRGLLGVTVVYPEEPCGAETWVELRLCDDTDRFLSTLLTPEALRDSIRMEVTSDER